MSTTSVHSSKNTTIQVILHAGPIFVGEDYQCRRQLVTFGETPKAEFRWCCALMSLSHLEVKGIGNGRKPIVLLNQNVPTSRIPIPKNRGVANKREVSMFRQRERHLRFWKSRWTRTSLWEKKSGKLVAEMTLQANRFCMLVVRQVFLSLQNRRA